MYGSPRLCRRRERRLIGARFGRWCEERFGRARCLTLRYSLLLSVWVDPSAEHRWTTARLRELPPNPAHPRPLYPLDTLGFALGKKENNRHRSRVLARPRVHGRHANHRRLQAGPASRWARRSTTRVEHRYEDRERYRSRALSRDRV